MKPEGGASNLRSDLREKPFHFGSLKQQGRKGVVDQKNCEFYDQKTYLRQQRCYGVKSKTAVSCDGHRMNIHSYVFRSPSKEMTETDELLDRLEAFQKAWSRKKISVLSQADRKNLDIFVVTPNGNLTN